MKDNGVKLLSAMENIPDTPEGVILESMLEGMNQYFSAELAQKVKRGMKETRRKGYFQGGALLYGYKLEGRKIVVNEPQAEIVRFIFTCYSSGMKIKDIIAKLDGREIFKKGKPFNHNTIYNLLNNEKYSGKYMHDDEVVDNMYPQIIETDVFDKVQRKIQNNRTGRQSVKCDFLLSHKLVCGYCGNSINGESGTSRTGNRAYYYKCRGRKKHIADCHKAVIRKDDLERIVLDMVIGKLKEPKFFDAIIKKLMGIQEELAKNNTTLSALEQEAKHIENAIKNLLSAIEKGLYTETTINRLRELEESKKAMAKSIALEKSKEVIKFTESEIREYYSDLLKSEPRMIINYLVDKIVLFDDEIEIFFNSPIKCPDYDGQGSLLYRDNFKYNGTKMTIIWFAT